MDGIYILVTKNSYHVTYSNCFDAMIGLWSEDYSNYDLVPNVIEKEFGQSPIFLNENDAYEYALEMSHKYPETDDGIYYIKNASDKTYKEIING